MQPNYINELNSVPNDPYYSLQWGMGNINMPQVWDYTTGSNTVYVAVLDTGIDYNHPDLNANMGKDSYNNYGRYFYNGGLTSNNPMDIHGHGTHVAGIIGAVGNNGIGVVGVCWTVKMLAVNVFTPGAGSFGGPGAYDSDVINGINYVASEKTKGLNIRVANMSFGGWKDPLPDSSPFGAAIELLSNKGIICVMAAGNDNQNLNNPTGSYTGKKVYPSSFKFENTISVGSISSSNARSSFSNYGSNWVDIAAPGTDIYSTLMNNTYGNNSGTSMSAPHVTGAAALLCAAYPNESASTIKARILNKANKNYGVTNGYWKYGTLDVWSAYNVPSITSGYIQAHTFDEYHGEENYYDYYDGDTIWDRDFYNYIPYAPVIKFIPNPPNATITSILWKSDNPQDIIYDPDQIETLFESINLPGHSYLTVTVNEIYKVKVKLTLFPIKSPK